jgi:hypothetical protein
MNKLQDALNRVTFTHVLLFVIVVFLYLNWREFRTINRNLASIADAAQAIDGDDDDPDPTLKDIEIDLSH